MDSFSKSTNWCRILNLGSVTLILYKYGPVCIISLKTIAL